MSSNWISTEDDYLKGSEVLGSEVADVAGDNGWTIIVGSPTKTQILVGIATAGALGYVLSKILRNRVLGYALGIFAGNAVAGNLSKPAVMA